MTIGRVGIRPLFRWYDFWVGVYYDRMAIDDYGCYRFYVFPLPMLGFLISIKSTTDR
jgi:hypothetical protein